MTEFVVLSTFRMKHCMHDHLPYGIHRQVITVPEIYAAFARFDLRMAFPEFNQVFSAAGIQRYIVLLIGDRNPAFSVFVCRHFILHVHAGIRETFQDEVMQLHDFFPAR